MLLRWLRRTWSSARKDKRQKPVFFRQCYLEALEDRMMLSHAYLVNRSGDAAAGSGFAGDIRFVINAANADPGSSSPFDTGATGPTITLPQGELAISASMT